MEVLYWGVQAAALCVCSAPSSACRFSSGLEQTGAWGQNLARLKVRLGRPRVRSYGERNVFKRVVIDLIVCLRWRNDPVDVFSPVLLSVMIRAHGQINRQVLVPKWAEERHVGERTNRATWIHVYSFIRDKLNTQITSTTNCLNCCFSNGGFVLTCSSQQLCSLIL